MAAESPLYGEFSPSSAIGGFGTRPAGTGVAAAMVNTSNQAGGSLGAAVLNTIAATATTAYLASHHAQGAAAVRP
jgi:hypothetical protein